MDSSIVKDFFRKTWVRIFFVIDAIALLAVIIFGIVESYKTVTLTFNVTPVNAEILVNGRRYSDESYRIFPGKYEIKISLEGFSPKSFIVDLEPNYSLDFATFLMPEDGSFDFYTLRSNRDSYEKLAEIAARGNNSTYDADSSAEDFIAKMQKNLKLYQTALPIYDKKYEIIDNRDKLVYDITLRAGDSCEEILCIDAILILTDDKKKAETLLLEKGFNLEDYEIQYKIF